MCVCACVCVCFIICLFIFFIIIIIIIITIDNEIKPITDLSINIPGKLISSFADEWNFYKVVILINCRINI